MLDIADSRCSDFVDLDEKIIELTHAHESEIIESHFFNIRFTVAYVTHDEMYQPLNQSQIKQLGLDGIFALNAMPLLENGDRDLEALNKLIPPIDAIINLIKQEALACEKIHNAEVLTIANQDETPNLHIQSLLSDEATNAFTIDSKKATAPHTSDNKITHEDRPEALVSGVTLPKTETNKTLVQSLVNAAKQTRTAITYLKDTHHTSSDLAALLEQARKIRDGLMRSGMQAGEYALIHAEHPDQIIPAFWACILGGIIPTITPIPPAYHEQAAELQKLTGIWSLLNTPKIICSEASQSKLIESNIFNSAANNHCFLTIEALQNQPDTTRLEDHIPNEEDVAFMCLSSGSTGTPKCIQMTHKNVLVRSRGTNHLCRNTHSDIVLNWLPFDHIGSISDWHIRCIELGCEMVYCNKDIILTDPIEWINIIDKYRISHTWAPNFAYSAVNVALKKLDERKHWDLSCIDIFLTAAETVSSETIDEFSARLSEYGLKKHTIKPAFGMAEMGSGVTYNQPGEPVNVFTAHRDSLNGTLQEVPTGSANSVNFTCLGDIIPRMSMRIVDKSGKVKKEGMIGHLHMKGDCVSPGYYNNESANAVFLDDHWMDTGDEGFVLDKKLYLSGRTKDTIIIGGANYLPIEIEKTVEEIQGIAVSFVAATAVKPAQDKTESLAIFFSLSDDATDLKTIVETIKQNVPQKMGISPNYLVCLPKNEIPKTAIGKIQRSKLSKKLENGEFNAVIRDIDLLLENERTLPNWFAEQYWVKSKLVKHECRAKTSLALITFGQASLAFAEKLSDMAAHTSIHIETFFVNDIDRRSPLEKPQDDQSTSQRVRHLTLNGDAKDVDSLTPSLLSNHANIVNVLCLDDFNDNASDQLLAATQSIKKCVSSSEFTHKSTVKLSFLTIRETANTSDLADTDPILYQSLPALYRAVFSNEPGMSLTCIDVVNDGTPTQHLLDELVYSQESQEVQLDHQTRYVSKLRPYFDPETPHNPLIANQTTAKLQHASLYMITGGLGGVGQALSSWLLSNYKAKLIIVGRATRDDIEKNPVKNKALNELNTLGKIYYLSSKLTDIDQLDDDIRNIEELENSRIKGVFHLAGIVKETAFIDDTIESMQSVLDAKARSAYQIHRLFSKRSDAFSVYFSSTLSHVPSAIAPVYALANRFLDNLSELERRQNRESYSLAWSAWKNTGMSEGSHADALLKAQGLFSLTAENALSSLAIILSRPASNPIVGINRYADALSRICYTTSRLKNTLHLVYTSANDKPEAETWLSTQASTRCIPTTCLEEIYTKENGHVDIEKIVATVNGQEAFVEASTPVEIALSDIWCNVLKMDRVSINDNFFALGGHSLLAAELINDINKKLNTAFSLGSVFEASTIADQARLIDDEDQPEKAQIIALQPEGKETPLFCLCGIELYQTLANKLAPNIPVYSIYLPIEGKLLDANNTDHISVEEMAGGYIDAIKQVQKHGPYRLLGISFGGVLAYETARQLKAMGDEVEFVGIIDFVLPNPPVQILLTSKALSKYKVSGFIGSIATSLTNYTRTLKKKIISNMSSEPVRTQHIQAEYKRAFSGYHGHMERWDDRDSVLVFRSRDEAQQLGHSKKISCGWEKYMDSAPEAHIIPGDHLGVLKEPNVGILAHHLENRLLKRQE